MKTVERLWVGTLVALLAVASPAAAEDAGAAGEQIARGGTLYGKHCAKCHGDAGQGTKKAPAVVGAGALPLEPRPGSKVRKTTFKTAADVAGFVVTNMPGDKPGSLEAEAYWAILAFALKANGVDLKQPVDAVTAAAIVLHP